MKNSSGSRENSAAPKNVGGVSDADEGLHWNTASASERPPTGVIY